MAQVPVDEITGQDLVDWYNKKAELNKLKFEELTMRQRIARVMFPNPKEGTNNHALPDGAVLKMVAPIDRKVDAAVFAALQIEFHKRGIQTEELVEWEPKLKVGVYKKLPDEQKSFFDQCVTAKPGSPQLSIEIPKRPVK